MSNRRLGRTRFAVALALQLFGGHPETTAHGLVGLGIFVVAWLLADVVGGAFATSLPGVPR